jgi:hypothetical protein
MAGANITPTRTTTGRMDNRIAPTPEEGRGANSGERDEGRASDDDEINFTFDMGSQSTDLERGRELGYLTLTLTIPLTLPLPLTSLH